MCPNKTVIKIEDVHYSYKSGLRALKGISLNIYRSEFIAILGQNGSGKTTLAKHMNRLLLPTKGRVLIDGIDSKKISVAEASRKVGYVFQNPEHQIFANTIYEEVAFGLKNMGFSEEYVERRVKDVLNIVGLNKPLDFFPHFLSIGQKHRLAIASVLALNPDVIILDEPTTGLDFKACLNLMDLLKALNQQGKTIILITHDLYLVAEYAERVIIMKDGTKVADGNVRDILTDVKLLMRNSLVPLQVTSLAISLNEYGIRKDIIRSIELTEEIISLLDRNRSLTKLR